MPLFVFSTDALVSMIPILHSVLRRFQSLATAPLPLLVFSPTTLFLPSRSLFPHILFQKKPITLYSPFSARTFKGARGALCYTHSSLRQLYLFPRSRLMHEP